MAKLALISGKKLCKILEKLGFKKIYTKSSHIRYKHPDGRITVVPIHSGEKLGRGILRKILKQVELSREEYDKLR